MFSETEIVWDWEGNEFCVKVLCSLAGVATQILVHNKGTDSNILMDVGDGILRDLISLPKNLYENIDAILVSHGHFDHVGSIFSLLAFYRMLNRKKELAIFAAPGVSELKGLVNLFTENYADTTPFEYSVNEIESVLKFRDIVIQPFPVQHRGSLIGGEELPKIPALGFIISKNLEKIVFTGDTGYFDELNSYINGTDLALIEGTHEGEPSNYHLSISQAEELGKLAKHHFIIHKIPKISNVKK